MEKILPPRLEDAGLEDCALSSESIKEAFRRAASAATSRASSLFSRIHDEDECISIPGVIETPPDVFVGDSCDPSAAVDLIVGGDEDLHSDRVVDEIGEHAGGSGDLVMIGNDLIAEVPSCVVDNGEVNDDPIKKPECSKDEDGEPTLTEGFPA